jgi:hypothetical protein
MPITFHPSTKSARPVEAYEGVEEAQNPNDLFRLVSSSGLYAKCDEILQSNFISGVDERRCSVESDDMLIDLSQTAVEVAKHGLVGTVMQAYNWHHNLILRPDDIWIAILVQFNLYVNAHAEELRHLFVEHSGKKHLIIDAIGTRYSVDFGALSNQMSQLIQKNVLDADLRRWLIPDFTTTTANDRIVASVVMMATLAAYFTYEFHMLCGIPSVTLLGEREDWEKLLMKIDKLLEYGPITTKWHELLKPILSRFVVAFDSPDSKANLDFWANIATVEPNGSGGGEDASLSGWITAFCFFGKDGKSQDHKHKFYSKLGEGFKYIDEGLAALGVPPPSLNIEGETYEFPPFTDVKTWDYYRDELLRVEKLLHLDGAVYFPVDFPGEVPSGYAEVDVMLDDNGERIESVMVAGLVGSNISSSGLKMDGQSGERDTLQPVPGWWIATFVSEQDLASMKKPSAQFPFSLWQ